MNKKILKPKEYRNKECTFLGRTFYIDERAHIPRPSIEFITPYYIERINKLKGSAISIADIGTGTGVLSASIALQCPHVKKIYAVDLYEEALQVANINISKFGLSNKIILKQGNLLEPLMRNKIDIIVANLPFADDRKMKRLRPEVAAYEPLNGIYGGKTGFELYAEMFSQLAHFPHFNILKGIWILCHTDHATFLDRYKEILFHKFKLMTIQDNYKSCYAHYYFYRDYHIK